MTLPFPIRKWHPDPQEYAIDIQRANHDQALAHFGEYSMFSLMWRLEDFQKGLVDRCPTCYLGKTADVYGQASQKKCPDCFGTTFEGGYKARIVRLALWDMQEKTHEENRRGEIERQTASVQSTSDFRLRSGDFAFRADGSRWQVQALNTNHLRTGFMMPTTSRTPVGYNFGTVIREDESSVAYIIPPEPENSDLWDILNQPIPTDFSEIEHIRGDLLHEEESEDGGSGSVGESS